ncbi:armadillo-type protein [Clohesyomyces aquaticus]|uniref:Armadillo-type protein n=1 Tax=Clohesyomyces aquaticus TaxID=1231657 RepID=A0A1Y2A692_9PLEO|nr:armadillo-type protein [Clohesyomyces aquaticus]
MSLNITSDGSPTPRKSSSRFIGSDELRVDTSPEVLGLAVGSRYPFPSRMTPKDITHFQSIYPSLTYNMQGVKRPNSTSQEAHAALAAAGRGNAMAVAQNQQQMPMKTMAGRQSSENYKKLKVETEAADVYGSLMQRLSAEGSQESPQDQYKKNTSSSNGSVPITPATDNGFTGTPITEPDNQAVVVDANEYHKLRQELENAQHQVARMKEELHTTHLTKSTLDHAIGQSSETDYNYYKGDVTEHTISALQSKFNASTRPTFGRQESWPLQEDSFSDKSDGLSAKPFNNGQAIWGNGGRQANNAAPVTQQYPNPFYGNGTGLNVSFGPVPPQPRSATGQSGYRGRNGYLNEPTHFPLEANFRGGLASNPPSRPGSVFDGPHYNQYQGYANSVTHGSVGGMSPTMGSMPMPPMGAYTPTNALTPYQPRPIGTMGTRLSPEAAEFSVDTLAPTPWNAQPTGDLSMQYITPNEPMNYRRLLDRNMNCNWKYIVDKIICNNDQQASIFLQQKLKVGTSEQKFEIVEAIIAQAYPLMVNRFGNFLVQRCFEHGTPEQVVAIAQAIRGNTLTLSMDAFGCHVVQKAFDAVPEEYKATMVHELLRRIPETVIHRYACHVWQKLFELRWNDSPPQIMRYVNEALRGMWHEVALGETGSLVVQNIFENCLEEDKRPCINEVLASIDVISHGQFGNWCIQHICEHGAPADRNRAIDHILRLATEYSMDQYASKVIEKCLKIGGNDFLDRYLERVCEGRPDRPRMPLIDIAGDQFGNYLIQYVLTHCGTHHRELVASHVRKHMVSLRGSKYGSRVAMLCCNPALATRPGPPAGMQINRYGAHNIHRGGSGASSYSGFR